MSLLSKKKNLKKDETEAKLIKVRKRSVLGRLRTNFFTGLVVAAPLAITGYLTYWVVTSIDSWILPFIPEKYNPENYLPFSLPGFGLILALMGITIVGAFTTNLFGRSVISYWERLLNRMPVIRSVYNALKQIFETALSNKASSFSDACIIQYPRRGLYAMAFVSRQTEGEIPHRAKEGEMMSVFLPTTPNPTSGFLLFVPKKDVIILDMSVEEAAKLVISAGLVVPEFNSDEKNKEDQVPQISEETARELIKAQEKAKPTQAAE